MKYTVTWQPSAIQELADLWMAADDKSSVESSSNRIDRLLRDDSSVRGDDAPGDLRSLKVFPLAVDFVLRRQDRTVLVSTVWRAEQAEP